MTRPQDARPLPDTDFRARRAYLADHVFLSVPGGGAAPTDTVPQETWEHLLDLPTDVLLRTTDYQGSLLDDSVGQTTSWSQRMFSAPELGEPIYDVALDASDEFHAAIFASAHGWYRLGTSGLRTALELTAQGAGYSAIHDPAGYTKWRDSGKAPELGESLGRLKSVHPNDPARQALGVIARLYGDLSRSTHSNPGSSHVDIWKSSGPVWVGSGFTTFWLDLSDTLAACYVLARLSLPVFALPAGADVLFQSPSPRWPPLGDVLLADLFEAP